MSARALAFTGDGQLHTGPGTFVGTRIVETGASTAEVRFYDGTSNAGVLLDVVKLTSGQVQSGHGIEVWYSTGLYVDVVSGTLTGIAFIA